jgi:hypothetical protein
MKNEQSEGKKDGPARQITEDDNTQIPKSENTHPASAVKNTAQDDNANAKESELKNDDHSTAGIP